MMPSLRIKTLGGLAIGRDGEPLRDFASRKVEALLVYLACSRRGHAREALAALFWDERTQQQAMANLRVVLSSLRKEAGPYVAITRDFVALSEEGRVWLDVAELEAAAARLRKENGIGSAATAEVVVAAVGLYAGDFLEGFSIYDARGFEAWMVAERERLRRLVTGAMQELGAWYLRQADYASAMATSTRLLELDPFAEVAHRQLMEALARHGQRSQALAVYEALVETLWRELAVEPSAETRELVKAIRAEKLEEPPPAAPVTDRRARRLPAPATPLIGRKRELGELEALLLDGSVRLVSVVGPGGSGKTRLSVEVATRLANRYRHDTVFVPLAPLSAPSAIPTALATALDFRSSDRASPQEQIVNYLANKELLLVLDNFEHLLDGARLVAELLERAPLVKVLVTSRTRLQLGAECVYEVGGMDIPANERQVVFEQVESVQMFLAHARRLQPGFQLAEADKAALARICRLVEGMPLALELAASWVRYLPLPEIADELAAGLDFLESERADLPERQRSMRAAFDYSWNLLDEAQREALMKLSVFRGGASRQAARAVTGASLRTLAALADHYLLSRDPASGRFAVHELVRQFAWERLGQVGEADAVRAAHSAYYLDLLCRLGEDVKGSDHQLKALETIDADIENIRLAWHWAIDDQAYDRLREAVPVLALALRYRARVEEGERLFRQAADILNSRNDEASKRLLGQVMARQAEFAAGQLDYGKALNLLERSLATARRSGAKAEIAYCLGEMGRVLVGRGERQRAKPLLEESLEIAFRIGAWHTQVGTLIALHGILTLEGEYMQAVRLARQLMALCRETGDKYSLGDAMYRLGVNSSYLGDYEEGKRYLEESLAIVRQLNHPHDISMSQAALALYATRVEGTYEEARALAEQSLALARSVNYPASMSMALVALGDVACWQERYAEAVRRAEASLQMSDRAGGSEVMHFGRNVLSLALCGLGVYEEARNEICRALQLTRFHTHKLLLLCHVAGMALVLTHEGDHEGATELYALAASHHDRPPAWLEKLPLHIHARNILKAELPADIFDRAWKRGEDGYLHEALRGVLSKYCL